MFTHRKRTVELILLALLALTLGACAAFAPEPQEIIEEVDSGGQAGISATSAPESELSGGNAATDGDTASIEEPMEEAEESAPLAPEADRSEGGAAGAPAYGSDDTASGDAVAPSQPEESYIPPDEQISPLQAGEVDDNEEFEEYLQYRLDFQKFLNIPVSNVDVSERHIIHVTTRSGQPVLGADVLIYDGQRLVTALKTTASGRAYFFPMAYGRSAQSYTVTVEKGQSSQNFNLTRDGSRSATWDVGLGVSPTRAPVKLDVLFLLDATGSMSDEITQLKDNILSISAQIEALPGQPDVRFGLVHYRDRGDSYVTRRSDFTGNVQAFQRDLSQVTASGGGDDPESMNEALHVAVNNMDWRGEDTIRIIFLVADAPPHLDYPQDYDYAAEMMTAASMGIKIFPIGSRLDGQNAYQQQAEYIFRQLAQFTGGSFIFLTYEDTPRSDGDPGTDYSVQEDQYSVEDLDALVVRLVQEELAALTGGQ